MTWLAFVLGTIVGVFAGMLILSLCIMSRAEMPDVEDVEP